MNKTTLAVIISGGKCKAHVLEGHLSPSQVQLALLKQGIGCAKVLRTIYNHQGLVQIRF